MRLPELLAPAGDFAKLESAFHFGADAVYCAGKNFGLRAACTNFDDETLVKAVKTAHSLNKKVFVTLNIYARENDFAKLKDYAQFLQVAGVDGVIISDSGVFDVVRKSAPDLELHISTQANITNKFAAKFWADQGAARIVLARELSIAEISAIRDFLPNSVELEAFVHGAMCVSYSGRCLLSDLFTGRGANRGECVQACRWEYSVKPIGADSTSLIASEDERGTYFLNSKDLCMIEHLDKLYNAGVSSFKIEGRMKSVYYVATVVNAYRKAIDLLKEKAYNVGSTAVAELEKTSHRLFTTGFYFKDNDSVGEICSHTSQPKSDFEFCAQVLGFENGRIVVEQRNRFFEGDELELLSADNSICNAKIKVVDLRDSLGNAVFDAKGVQQILNFKTDFKALPLDILRKKKIN